MDQRRRTASTFGWLFIATFLLSIPAFFILYSPVLDKPNYVTGAGADESFPATQSSPTPPTRSASGYCCGRSPSSRVLSPDRATAMAEEVRTILLRMPGLRP